MGCGVYGVAGYNFLDGIGANDNAIFGESGLFLRIDIVFDEEWTCGAGSISGQTFIDLNANGIREDTELGLAGLHIDLLSQYGKILKTTYSGEAGSYMFTVKPGRYTLQIALPKHYRFSPIFSGDSRNLDSDINPDSGQSNPLDIAWGQHLNSIDIGIVKVDGGRP